MPRAAKPATKAPAKPAPRKTAKPAARPTQAKKAAPARKAAAQPEAKPTPAATTRKGKASLADKLTPKAELFVHEYLIDFNGTQAYLRSHPGVKATSASVEACRLLGNPSVQAALSAARAKTVNKLEITREEWLAEMVGVYKADVNELIQYRRLCCAECWPGERSKKLDPNPQCVECEGEGHGDVLIADTRKLSPAARALYAGVKITKDGLEVKMHSKLEAGKEIGKHMGWYEKDNEQKGKGAAEAIAEFVAGIHARQAGRLPIAAPKNAGPLRASPLVKPPKKGWA
ncbi:MAG: terminase small subunit [Paucibacter sp.]|nr:terminase small subunit [Roseateles sp.]